MEVDDPNIPVEKFHTVYEKTFKLDEDSVEIRMLLDKKNEKKINNSKTIQ